MQRCWQALQCCCQALQCLLDHVTQPCYLIMLLDHNTRSCYLVMLLDHVTHMSLDRTVLIDSTLRSNRGNGRIHFQPCQFYWQIHTSTYIYIYIYIIYICIYPTTLPGNADVRETGFNISTFLVDLSSMLAHRYFILNATTENRRNLQHSKT